MADHCNIRVLPLWEGKKVHQTDGVVVVSTVSKSREWNGLSPFIIGPCELYGGYTSQNMENAWQYSKCYREHIDFSKDQLGIPALRYFHWAQKGWNNPRAVRYPMGKGKKPEWSWWEGERLPYVPARKRIYAPLYAKAVRQTDAYARLRKLYQNCKELILLDYDAYDHQRMNRTLTDVLHDPERKMGHAFVLAMLLKDDAALDHFDRYL